MKAPERVVRSFLDRVAPSPATEAAGGKDPALELATPAPDHLADATVRAVQKLRSNAPLEPHEQFAVEAIIIPDKRPAIRILDGDFTITHPLWLDFGKGTTKSNIQSVFPSVGRIDLPRHPTMPYGGTGFVVGEDLLMTNRHVAEIFTAGLGTTLLFDPTFGTGVDFKREREESAAVLLEVADVVMIHPYWDMALLKVQGLRPDHAPLRLSTRAPDELLGRPIAVVGYPAFDPRNDAAVQNQVFQGIYNVKRLQPGMIGRRESIESFGKSVSALTHDSSTLGGNSGSLVFDPAANEVVALHFAGLYLKANYSVPTAELSRDRRVVAKGLNFIGSPARGDTDWDAYWDAADRGEGIVRPPSVSTNGKGQVSLTRTAAGSWTASVPLEISVSLGGVDGPLVLAAPGAPTEKMVEPDHDEDLSGRKGYDEGFLKVAVPLPDVKDDSVVALTRSGSHILKYHHFSLVMHKTRRIALYTASNIDTSDARRRPEPGKDYSRKGLTGLGKNDIEKWFIDTRIAESHQLPDRFFTKDDGAFDKGHIVRREDVAWGRSYDEIRMANGDTYHTTNCSPQVAGFNRSNLGEDNWGDLENYVLKQAATERLSLFAGPVLAKDDQVFVGVDDEGPVRVQIPQRYWKVVLAERDGALQSFAFVIEQDLSDTPLEFAVGATWIKYMVTVQALQEMLTIKFPKIVHDGDQAGTDAGESVRAGAGVKIRGKVRESATAAAR